MKANPLTIIIGLLFYHPGLAALFAATALILIAALRLSAVRLNRAETQLISALVALLVTVANVRYQDSVAFSAERSGETK